MAGDGGPSEQGPQFKGWLVFFLVVGVVGLGIRVWLAAIDPSLRDDLAEAADWLMKSGLGAVIGMYVDRRVR